MIQIGLRHLQKHQYYSTAAFSKNINGRKKTTIAELLLLKVSFHRQVRVIYGVLVKNSVNIFFPWISFAFCILFLSIKMNRAVGSYLFTLQRTSMHFNLL